MIAVDASAAVLLVCDPAVEPRVEPARAALLADLGWVVPEHWLVEVASVLRGLDRAGKLVGVTRALQTFSELAVTTAPTRVLLPRIWQLRHALTAYDAAYVAAAELHGCPLITADARLARAIGPRCEIHLLS